MDLSFLSSPWLWGILGALGILSWATIKKFAGKLPFINQQKTFVGVMVILFLLTSGVFSMLSIGSLATTSSAGGWSISDVQVTALTPSYVGGTIALDSSNPYLINGRYTDAQSNETSGVIEMNTSTFTITRTGSLPADSCVVNVVSNDYSVSEVTGQQSASPYNILEKDVTGRYKVYLKDGTGATTSDSQGSVSVAFAEGVATEQFSMIAQVDEESHDALNQYSFRDVTIDVCGKPIVYRVFRMD